MEELRFYLDLVAELGDPFTVFERNGPDDVVHISASPGPASSDGRNPAMARWIPFEGSEDEYRDWGAAG